MTEQERLRDSRYTDLQTTPQRRTRYALRTPNCTAILVFMAAISPACQAAELTAQAEQGFNRYVALTETRMKRDLPPQPFLWLDSHADEKAKVRSGTRLVLPRKTQDGERDIEVTGALIQDWMGAMFIPHATLAQVRSVMQDYPDYKKLFAPEIIESRIVTHKGDNYAVFLRLFKKQVLTVVLNAQFDIRYASPGPGRLTVDSHSSRIAEVRHPKDSSDDEYPPGHDTGFLWRLNSYWRFEEGDGGVYAECEAISLSRDVPFGLGWLVRGFVQKFPKESMENTLNGVRRAVEGK